MHLVQLLLPLYDHTGRRVPHERFALVRDELTELFDGVTAYLRSPLRARGRKAMAQSIATKW